MLFSSVTFLFYFLPLFLLCYAVLPFRNATALLFSAIFYAWGEGLFLSVLVVSVLLNYVCGRWIDSASERGRQRALTVGVIANLTLLGYFKYFGFLVVDIFGWQSFNPDNIPHLPLGISFFTFQSISYLVDVYRRDAKVADSILDLALYIMMFPQLIAGPIVRYARVARQLRRRVVHVNYLLHGLMFFAIGLAQKMLIANNMAGVADSIYGLPQDALSTGLAWTGATTYTLQIYFDFAGYSNMAIGLGLVMGFKFPQNFNYPYISQSITDFWRRWHMSLSSWFRDYLYIPLGGNRVGSWRTYRNLLIVFLLCGLWHGAAWTFVVWGFYNGAFLIMERWGLGARLARLPRLIRHAYALLAIVVGWVIFRADTLPQAGNMLRYMFGMGDISITSKSVLEYVNQQQLLLFFVGLIASTPLPRSLAAKFMTDRHVDVRRRFPAATVPRDAISVAIACLLLIVCFIYVASGTYNPFIYFRF